MSGNGAPPRGTLAADLRLVRAALTDAPVHAVRLLDAAIERAEHERTQGEIWHGEAAQRETAVARLEVVHAELDRAQRMLPDPDGPAALYAQGGSWVIGQIREALDADQAGHPAANLKAAP